MTPSYLSALKEPKITNGLMPAKLSVEKSLSLEDLREGALEFSNLVNSLNGKTRKEDLPSAGVPSKPSPKTSPKQKPAPSAGEKPYSVHKKESEKSQKREEKSLNLEKHQEEDEDKEASFSEAPHLVAFSSPPQAPEEAQSLSETKSEIKDEEVLFPMALALPFQETLPFLKKDLEKDSVSLEGAGESPKLPEDTLASLPVLKSKVLFLANQAHDRLSSPPHDNKGQETSVDLNTRPPLEGASVEREVNKPTYSPLLVADNAFISTLRAEPLPPKVGSTQQELRFEGEPLSEEPSISTPLKEDVLLGGKFDTSSQENDPQASLFKEDNAFSALSLETVSVNPERPAHNFEMLLSETNQREESGQLLLREGVEEANLKGISASSGRPDSPTSFGKAHVTSLVDWEDLKIQFTSRINASQAQGPQRLTIQLKPETLGEIEVQLEFAADGKVAVLIESDRSSTLELLQRESKGLEQALENAGIRADSGSLNFNLRSGGEQQNSFGRHVEKSAPKEVSVEIPLAHGELNTTDPSRALDIQV